MSAAKLLMNGYLQIIIPYARLERKLLKGRGENALKGWKLLTPVLNSLNGYAIKKTPEEWRKVFQECNKEVHNKHKENQPLTPIEKELILLEFSALKVCKPANVLVLQDVKLEISEMKKNNKK